MYPTEANISFFHNGYIYTGTSYNFTINDWQNQLMSLLQSVNHSEIYPKHYSK